EARAAVAWLSGELVQGRIGIGWAAVRDMESIDAAAGPALTIAEVDAELGAIATAAGPGSSSERRRRLAALFPPAPPAERDFLGRLLLGGLRQGALEGVMLEAVAKATGISSGRVRRAAMLAGSLIEVAAAALEDRTHGLDRFELRVMQPVLPM